MDDLKNNLEIDHKNVFESELEKPIQECKETSDLISHRDQYILNEKLHVFNQNYKRHYKIHFVCKKCLNTFTSVEVLLKPMGSC